MSQLFESLDSLQRSWESRILENQSPRSVFLWLLAVLFLLGMLTSMFLYELVRQHRLDWAAVILLATLGLTASRYARVIYRLIK
jgi:hypothetical protein